MLSLVTTQAKGIGKGLPHCPRNHRLVFSACFCRGVFSFSHHDLGNDPIKEANC